MKTRWLMIIPVATALLVTMLVPYPSYFDSREISVNLDARLIGGVIEISLESSSSSEEYLTHVNAFWTTNVKNNDPPQDYSWRLVVYKYSAEGKEADWISHYYWSYDIKAGYWLNSTYSFEGKVNDSYWFEASLHYELPIGSGEVAGTQVSDGLVVS